MIMETLQDYAHLYIGCKVQTKYRVETESMQPMKQLKGILKEVDLSISTYGILLENETNPNELTYLDDFKLILRPLSSMTDDEMKEAIMFLSNGKEEMYKNIRFEDDNKVWYQQKYPRMKYWMTSAISFDRLEPKIFIWALRKSFDLFNLKDKGLAIYE